MRHELSTNPNGLQAVSREALGVLAVDSKAALVRMNPQDLGVLDDVLRQEFAGLALTLLGDASITRGGCLVESAGPVGAGTLERRGARAVGLVRSGVRLVVVVEHAPGAGADLRGEPEALGLAPGVRGGATPESEVVETDVDEEAQTLDDLLDDATADLLVALGKPHVQEEV